jgi:phospholipid/cholesterol/gamma-HCH transport system substrate-binding protein
MSRRREAWIGVTIVAAAAIFFLLYTTVRDIRWWSGGRRVYAVVPDAGRVTPGVPVLLHGVDVGQVTDRRLLPDLRVLLELNLEEDVAVPADSRVELASRSIFGEPVVNLVPGRAAGEIRSGDTLVAAVEPAPTELLERVGERAADALAPEFVADLRATVREFQDAAAQLNALLGRTAPALAATAASLRRSAAGLEEVAAGPELKGAAERLTMTAEELAAMAAGLSGAARRLEAILAKVDAGEGSLGRLVNDPGLYEDLRALAGSYRALAEDLRQNPGRYVRFSLF